MGSITTDTLLTLSLCAGWCWVVVHSPFHVQPDFCYVRLSWVLVKLGSWQFSNFQKMMSKKIWVKKYFDQIKFWAWNFLWLKKVGQKKNCITQTLYKSFQSQIIMKFTNILRTNSHWNFYQKFIWEKLNKNIPFSNLFDFKW